MIRIALFLAAIASAQEPIRVTTRLIETNVTVRDSHGPVADLTQEAFKIFDDGKEQRIAVFRVTKPAAAFERTSAPVPPAGVFTNRTANRTQGSQVSTALLIDTLNTELFDQVDSRRELLKMLTMADIGEPVAIYVLGQDFQVLQDFTRDKQLLIKAVEGFKPKQSHALFMADTPTPMMFGGSPKTAEVSRQAFAQIREHANYERATASMKSLDELVKQLERVPGKKSVVWISNAFSEKVLRHDTDLMQRLNAANISISSVHARGLVVGAVNPRDPVGPGVADYGGEVDLIKWVADQTGGRAFYGRNDIGQAVLEAIQDHQVSYTLGFYAHSDKQDGAFHRLRVRVDRTSLDVRSRAGYFDLDKKTTFDGRPVVAEDANDVGLIAAIARKDASYQVAVQVDFKDLRLESENGRWKGSAELAFLSVSADGRVLDATTKSLNFDMTEDAYRSRLKEGIAVEQTIASKPGIAKIRIVVVDRAGGAGSVTLDPLASPSR